MSRTAGGGLPLLRMAGITKRFGNVIANDAIDLDLGGGEIVGLLGENGAGKTTLMNVLFGHLVPDAGAVVVADAEGRALLLPPGSPRAALQAGVGMVHQHFTLADNLDAIENVGLGTQPLWSPRLDRARVRRRLASLIDATGLDVRLNVRIGDLSIGERQRVELLKALYRGARVLILDEPTAVLTRSQAAGLGTALRALAGRGIGVLFIGHKLDEIVDLCDRAVVLRRGKKVLDAPIGATGKAELARAMVEREVPPVAANRGRAGAVMVEAIGVGVGPKPGREPLYDLRLAVHEGEILGVAGVAGNGQKSLAALFAGTLRPDAGELRLKGVPWPDGPRALVRAGIGRIPEDRNSEGAIGTMRVWENAAIEAINTAPKRRFGLFDRGALVDGAEALVRAHDVRPADVHLPAAGLSGGNLQKLILGRVLDANPRFILACRPTRGLDLGAVAAVHRRLLDARAGGAAILLISEDLDELFALADRIAVIHAGRLHPAVPRESADLQTIAATMTGGGRDAA